jgi:uncharacterized protein YbjT (DUF2867 family)
MRVAVVGGTGTFGRLTVESLVRMEHEVVVLSRHDPGASGVPGATHRRVDLTTGSGLAEGVAGADVVLDASNAQKGAQAVLVEGTRRLLAAERSEGVASHVLISIVGIEKVPMGYYKAKLAQENSLRDAGVRVGILRSTQFHELLDMAFGACARLGFVPGGRIPLQPIAARDAAAAMAALIHEGPFEGRRSIAGPEVLTLGEMAPAWLSARGRRRLVVPVPALGKVGRPVGSGALTDPDAPRGTVTFDEWLRGVDCPAAHNRRERAFFGWT